MSQINPVQLQKFLKGVDYPASKDTLLENAKKMGADDNVCDAIEHLPDEQYDAPIDVSQALSKEQKKPH